MLKIDYFGETRVVLHIPSSSAGKCFEYCDDDDDYNRYYCYCYNNYSF